MPSPSDGGAGDHDDRRKLAATSSARFNARSPAASASAISLSRSGSGPAGWRSAHVLASRSCLWRAHRRSCPPRYPAPPPAGGAFIEPPLSPRLSPPASAFGTVISDSVCHGSDQPPNSLKGGGFRPLRDSVADAVEQREQGPGCCSPPQRPRAPRQSADRNVLKGLAGPDALTKVELISEEVIPWTKTCAGIQRKGKPGAKDLLRNDRRAVRQRH